MSETINVTKPFLPPIQKYKESLDQIWASEWLTNNGPFCTKLESEIKSFLDVPNFLMVSNGTIALQLAYKALGLSGEVITTPFTYVATISSLVWENCTPIMVDIDPETLNIDPKKIEAAITPNTTAILGVHVFGNPCDVEAIDEIAKRHKLKVIYDAAHAFGAKYKGKTLFAYGDASTASFHATKLFSTGEGGGIFFAEQEQHDICARMRNFGHTSPTSFEGVGINGKVSEFHAAFGLINIAYVPEIISKRKEISEIYTRELAGLVKNQQIVDGCEYNYSYYPVIFKSEEELLRVLNALAEENINIRRYFYPSLETLPYINGNSQNVSTSSDIACRIACLPLFPSLSLENQMRIIEIIKSVLLG